MASLTALASLLLAAPAARAAGGAPPGSELAQGVILLPPAGDVVAGRFEARTLVADERVRRVTYELDGEACASVETPPFAAVLTLADPPREQWLAATAYDTSGAAVASDRLLLNPRRDALRVRLLEPEPRAGAGGATRVRAEVSAPPERRIEAVTFHLDGRPVARLERPPWQTAIEAGSPAEVRLLSVDARLDDGRRAEDARLLAPEAEAMALDAIEVTVGELYVSVQDRRGRPVGDLPPEAFEVRLDGRPQRLVEVSRVDGLPLELGIVLDVSGSMVGALEEARRAAEGLIGELVGPRDRAFAVAFANRPWLVARRGSEREAIGRALRAVRAGGMSALYDAVILSLHRFRGVGGRRALILLSDGDDTSSRLRFDDLLTYARRSGVGVWTVGLETEGLGERTRYQLRRLAAETGGRAFFIHRAQELEAAYGEIAAELREQYLVAYLQAPQPAADEARLEVEVRRRGLRARATRGDSRRPW